jgi:hypothetical protein
MYIRVAYGSGRPETRPMMAISARWQPGDVAVEDQDQARRRVLAVRAGVVGGGDEAADLPAPAEDRPLPEIERCRAHQAGSGTDRGGVHDLASALLLQGVDRRLLLVGDLDGLPAVELRHRRRRRQHEHE